MEAKHVLLLFIIKIPLVFVSNGDENEQKHEKKQRPTALEGAKKKTALEGAKQTKKQKYFNQ